MTAGYGMLQFAGQVFFWVGVVVLILGLCILVSPAQVMRLGGIMNRWVSTDGLFQRLDSPTFSERVFYRHHRLCGVLLILGAVYVMYQFVWGIDYSVLFREAFIMGSHTAADWLARSLGFVNVAFSIVALVVGIVVFFRPSLLKDLEQRANIWFSPDRHLKSLDEQVTAPDRLFSRNPRLVGLLVVLGSLYVVASLSLFI